MVFSFLHRGLLLRRLYAEAVLCFCQTVRARTVPHKLEPFRAWFVTGGAFHFSAGVSAALVHRAVGHLSWVLYPWKATTRTQRCELLLQRKQTDNQICNTRSDLFQFCMFSNHM